MLAFACLIVFGISLRTLENTTGWLWWACFIMTALSSYTILIAVLLRWLFHLTQYTVEKPDDKIVAKSYDKNQVADNWHGLYN